MELSIQSRNLQVDQRTREYIQKKLAPLGRRLRQVGETTVEIRREKTRRSQERMVVQVTANVNGTLLRAEKRAPTTLAAVDVVAHALDQQALKYKGRHYSHVRGRRGSPATSIRSQEADGPTITLEDQDDQELEDQDDQEEVAAVLPTGRVVRIKRFAVKAMPVEEAALQMELLGHNFFLFLNEATEQHNVLYRRNDGDYGVIEPELR